MNTLDDVWLCLSLVALFGLLLYLRSKFPKVSRGRETAVLLVATIVFFLICNLFPGSRTSTTPKFGEAQANVLKR
jgi:hypothetical protein